MKGATLRRALRTHYARPNLRAHLLDALNVAENRLLTRVDLASLDEFHLQGQEATRQLMDQAQVQAQERVLDIGSGLGGPMRTLASEVDCRIVGLEPVDVFREVATLLTERSGLSDRIRYVEGLAPTLPFDEATFDIVWTQHVTMNVADKEALAADVARVLVPGGRWVFHSVCAGPSGAPHYPVPWAEDERLSFLVSPETWGDTIQQAGFSVQAWHDVTEETSRWIARAAAHAGNAPRRPGLGLLMGSSAREKSQNMVRNLAEGRLTVIMGTATQSSGCV